MIDTCKILREAETIAVVGFSKDKSKTSRQIALYLKSVGFNVIGINPTINEEYIDGIRIYKSLLDVEESIDIVDVFRKSEDIPQLIKDVQKVHPKVLWLQLGIRNDEAVEPLIKLGITVIQDTCIYVEHNNC